MIEKTPRRRSDSTLPKAEVRISQLGKDAFKVLADSQDRPASDLYRDALQEYLERRGVKVAL